jgi:hypothetical protein
MTKLLLRDHLDALRRSAMNVSERIDGIRGGVSFRAGDTIATFRFQEAVPEGHPTMRVFLDREDGYEIDLRIPLPILKDVPTTPRLAGARLAIIAEAMAMRSQALTVADERLHRIALLLHSLMPDELRTANDDILFVSHRSPLGAAVVSPKSFPTDWRASAWISEMLPVARTTKATMTGIQNAATSWTVTGLASRALRTLPNDPVTRLRSTEELITRFGIPAQAISDHTRNRRA